MWFALVFALSTFSTVYGWPRGAATSACQSRSNYNLRPGHNGLEFIKDDPKITLDTTVDGDTLNIVVSSAEKFRGIFKELP